MFIEFLLLHSFSLSEDVVLKMSSLDQPYDHDLEICGVTNLQGANP